MQTNINYCKVSNCRFKTTHTTRSHVCGLCNKKGHGRIECNDYYLKLNLIDCYNDIIDPENRCNIPDCELKLFHNTMAHQCEFCNYYGHSLNQCPNKSIEIICPICRTNNSIKINQKRISGLNIECCICMDKQVEIYFPECGHVCICNHCFLKSMNL